MKRAVATVGLALVAACALVWVAAGPAAASGTELHWYSCKNVGVGKGVYEDSACSKEGGSKTFAWSKLTTATPAVMTDTTPLNMRFNVAGIPLEVVCASGTSNATLQNPEPGSGNASFTFRFGGCAVAKPAGKSCVVKESKITSNSMVGRLTERETGGPKVILEATSGTVWAPITVEKCTTAFFNGTYGPTGSYLTSFDNGSSSVGFKESGSSLTLGGNPAYLEGTIHLETSAGEPLKVGH